MQGAAQRTIARQSTCDGDQSGARASTECKSSGPPAPACASVRLSEAGDADSSPAVSRPTSPVAPAADNTDSSTRVRAAAEQQGNGAEHYSSQDSDGWCLSRFLRMFIFCVSQART